MNRPARTARGQPLLVLSVILGSWVLVRAWALTSGSSDPALTLQTAVDPAAALVPAASAPPAAPAADTGREAESAAATGGGAPLAIEPVRPSVAPVPIPTSPGSIGDPRWRLVPAAGGASPTSVAPFDTQVPIPARPVATGPVRVAPKVAAAHQLLWMAALSQLPTPDQLTLPSASPAKPASPPQTASRWSADGWILWRRDGAGLAPGGFAPSTYGASQAGAVLRYRLAPHSGHRPAVFLRATSAFEAPRGEEAALGLAARPIPGLPVLAIAELRATRFQSGTKLRPAALAVSEFPPLDLPLRARAEAYVQAGYVGGAGASAFVDGQLRVDRPLLRIGRSELRAGGGVWGGAQEGASRLDAGPSATLGLPLGKANARLAMDWRFRLAGNAAPQSGPAVTLSAGF